MRQTLQDWLYQRYCAVVNEERRTFEQFVDFINNDCSNLNLLELIDEFLAERGM